MDAYISIFIYILNNANTAVHALYCLLRLIYSDFYALLLLFKGHRCPLLDACAVLYEKKYNSISFNSVACFHLLCFIAHSSELCRSTARHRCYFVSIGSVVGTGIGNKFCISAVLDYISNHAYMIIYISLINTSRIICCSRYILFIYVYMYIYDWRNNLPILHVYGNIIFVIVIYCKIGNTC